MLYLALIGLPIVSACMWSGMLIGMLVAWFSDGHPKYSSMADNQHLAYISDIGAQRLKALFVTGCIVTTLLFNTAIASECHFRRKGSLGQGSGTHSKYTSILSQTFASCGALGLILLSIFDTANHETAHNVFLFIFMLPCKRDLLLPNLPAALETSQAGKRSADKFSSQSHIHRP